MKIAILGGTGKEGAGLGLRWAAAGHEIIIGSRLEEKGAKAAQQLMSLLEGVPGVTVSGTDNLSAANQAELIVLSVPYSAQQATLNDVNDALQGKLLITVVVPIGKPAGRVWVPEGGSAAAEAQAQLGEGVRVVTAFQNISAEHLSEPDHDVDCDVLVCGNKKADREVAITLAADAGMRGVHAGSLTNSSVVEGLTAVMIAVNVRYGIKNAGIRITGIDNTENGG